MEPSSDFVDVETLFKALADPLRIKILAAVIDRELSVEEIAAAVKLSPQAVARHLWFLTQVGLAQERQQSHASFFRFNRRPLLAALKSVSEKPGVPDLGDDVDAFDRKVLTDFMVDGRLKAIPAQHKKREAVLRFLAGQFEPERMYEEKEVNAILRRYHDDSASLRRYLVDGGFLSRQIIREVETEALMAGAAQVDLRVLYWKPRPSVDV